VAWCVKTIVSLHHKKQVTLPDEEVLKDIPKCKKEGEPDLATLGFGFSIVRHDHDEEVASLPL